MAAVRAVAPFLVPAVFLALWQVSAAEGWIAPQILPAPAIVVQTFIDLLRAGDIAANLEVSLRRISFGFALGAPFGLALGVLLGVSERTRAYLEPLLRAVFAIPTLGWIPILILIFGIEEALKVLVIAKAVLVPIVLNTSQGIRNIPTSYLDVAEALQLRPFTRLLKLTLPAALPAIFTGLRLALSSAFIALVVVEMLAAAEGVGYMMVWGRTLFQLDIVIVGMIVVGLIGFALDAGLRRLERGIARWSASHE
jgi:sulfonate transport system permease protein